MFYEGTAEETHLGPGVTYGHASQTWHFTVEGDKGECGGLECFASFGVSVPVGVMKVSGSLKVKGHATDDFVLTIRRVVIWLTLLPLVV